MSKLGVGSDGISKDSTSLGPSRLGFADHDDMGVDSKKRGPFQRLDDVKLVPDHHDSKIVASAEVSRVSTGEGADSASASGDEIPLNSIRVRTDTKWATSGSAV